MKALIACLALLSVSPLVAAPPADAPKPGRAAKGDPRAKHVEVAVPAGVKVFPDQIFATYGSEQMLIDVFQPAAATAEHRLPAVLVVTGGGWTMGDRKRLGHIAMWLSGHGFVTAACDYKLAKPGEPSFPRNIQDCKAAVRYLRANAGKYGIDADRIGIVGGSAGGHLVALLGASNGVKKLEGEGGNAGVSSAVQAVAVMAGPVDLESERYKEAKAPLVLVGKTYAEAPELFALASPLHHLKAGAPPFLFMDGSKDQPEVRYTEFRAKLKQLGIREQMVVVDDAPHGMWNMEGWFPEVSKTLLEFFQSTLASAK